MKGGQLKTHLAYYFKQYHSASFTTEDPISIPHRFSKKQDIEIMAFWVALLAWGNRKSIIRSGLRLVKLMDYAPHDFILHHTEEDTIPFESFKHRTFNGIDALYFLQFLQFHYHKSESLETAFSQHITQENKDIENALIGFRNLFFSLKNAPLRTRKHIATPLRGSACKRLNMFLRWMVREDSCGIDFGLWKTIRPNQLICPLDVHVVRAAVALGLLENQKADWKAATALTEQLRQICPDDPVRYDYALFGMGLEMRNQK